MKRLLLICGAAAAMMMVASAASMTVVAQAPGASAWTGPKTVDGQPDVQGVWDADLSGTYSLTHPISGGAAFNLAVGGKIDTKNPSRIVDPADGLVPYQPWAAALQKRQQLDAEYPTRPEHIDTQNRCIIGGVPRPFYNTQIMFVQPRGYVIAMSDQYQSARMIALDGRPHIGKDLKLYMGDSVGRWEGNTLVTDVTSLNGRPRLSMVGDFISNNAHITERIQFHSRDKMTYSATITDPRVFTRPWTLRVEMTRRESYEFWEQGCHEGERSAAHMLIEAAR